MSDICIDDKGITQAGKSGRLPLGGLLALAMAGFITILTEALPAGLLPQMSADLGVSPAMIGQLVTIYALGSLLAAIPLTAATQTMRRKPLLLCAIAGFAIVNTVTAITGHFGVMLVARFFAGVSAGLLWALVAGYAGRMVTEHLRGRAIAVAMVGIPLALSLGIPAGTFIGSAVGWRVAFMIMSALTIVLILWAVSILPDFPGNQAAKPATIAGTLAMPGVKPVLFVTLTFVLAHNLLYTYIAPFVVPAGLSQRLDVVLLLFGAAAIIGIVVVGLLIDRWLRELVLASTLLFIVVAVALGLWGNVPSVLYTGVFLWGLAFGGVATLFQTAAAATSGAASDVAQSMVVTVWNMAIAGGGLLGGLLLNSCGVASFPWVLVVLLLLALLAAYKAQAAGFPARITT